MADSNPVDMLQKRAALVNAISDLGYPRDQATIAAAFLSALAPHAKANAVDEFFKTLLGRVYGDLSPAERAGWDSFLGLFDDTIETPTAK